MCGEGESHIGRSHILVPMVIINVNGLDITMGICYRVVVYGGAKTLVVFNASKRQTLFNYCCIAISGTKNM